MKNKATISFLAFLWVFCAIIPVAYSQISGKWVTASSTGFQPRDAFTSSVVNGKIYVIGGEDATSTFVNTLQIYDPSADAWSTSATTGTFTPRLGLTSSVVDGKIYVMGGWAGPQGSRTASNILEVFDPSTNAWSTPQTTGTFTPRFSAPSCVVNGKIYVIGGFDGNSNSNTGSLMSLTTVEVFDPATNNWSTLETTGSFTARAAYAIGVVNDKIYVLGGYDDGALPEIAQVFDPLTSTWSTLRTTGTFTPRFDMGYDIIDGKIYVIGGGDFYNGGLSEDLNTFEIFDPSTNKWSTPKATGTFAPRSNLSCSVVNGKIYAIGGYNVNLTQVFTPANASVNNDDAASLDIKIAPNPTIGPATVFNISPGAHITIENILGETVMDPENFQTSDATFDLSKLPAGTYFARIATPNSVVMRKIVRE